jgi:hypothetical protein
MTGIIKLVHRAEHPDGPFKTIGEVAEYFERDRSTIRKWCKRIGDIPSHSMPLNDKGQFVWLYTENDIRELEKYSATINPKGGRPKKRDGVSDPDAERDNQKRIGT